MAMGAALLSEFLTQRRLRFVSTAVLTVNIVLATLSFLTATNGRTLFGTQLGADYAVFYVAGKILNEHGPGRLYDTNLQSQLFHELHPHVAPHVVLPYAHPPFFALPFRLLAKLPYATSFFVWLLISAGLYAAGLQVMSQMTDSIPRAAMPTVWLLALSFEPFIMECWLGGQVAAFGFLCLSLAIRYALRDRPLAAGLALGFCLYKPPLLLVLVPLLVLARQFRLLVGLTATGLALALISLIGTGAASCRDYASVLTGFVQSTAGGPLEFRTWKYIDLMSFFRPFARRQAALVVCLAAMAAAGPAWYLAKTWWRYPQLDPDRRRFLWAATLTGTLVLNLYVGIYDSVLVVLASVLTVAVFYRRTGGLPTSLVLWLTLLYVIPWFSQEIARTTGFQVFTLVLLGWGAHLLTRVVAEDSPGW